MTNPAGGSSGVSGGEREALRELARRWEREAYDNERMANDTKRDYTAIERRLLTAQANVRRGCAHELKTELSRVRRAG